MEHVKVDSHLPLAPSCSIQAVRIMPPQPPGSFHHWGRNYLATAQLQACKPALYLGNINNGT